MYCCSNLWCESTDYHTYSVCCAHRDEIITMTVSKSVIFYCGGGGVEEEQKRQNLPCVLIIEGTFSQVSTFTNICDLTMQCYPHSQQDVNAPSLPGKLYIQLDRFATTLLTEIILSHYSCYNYSKST